MRSDKGRNIIVVGTSAGGLEALDQLVGQLPTDLPASLFLVQHMAAHNSGEPLLRRLSRHQAFQPKLAEDGKRFKPGRIDIAPPDSHLLLNKDRVLVTKGLARMRRPYVLSSQAQQYLGCKAGIIRDQEPHAWALAIAFRV